MLKNKKIKRTMLALIVITLMLSSFTTSSNVANIGKTVLKLDNGNSVSLTKQQLNDVVTVTQDEAIEMAKAFVTDMAATDTVVWNESTEYVSIIPMYDNTNNNEITAYTVNFDTGYVVVSAYLDAQALIPEWSDVAAPLCEELEVDANDKVIYLGSYEYYVDDGTNNVTSLNGKKVEKAELTNLIEPTRDLANIPDSAVVQYGKNNNLKNEARTVNIEIYDPVGHANRYYDGPFVRADSISWWENYVDYYTTSYGNNNGYYNHCGPTAISNAVIAFCNRYPNRAGTAINYNNNQIFTLIANYGLGYNYFSNQSGTDGVTVTEYTRNSFLCFGISLSVSNINALGSFDELKRHLLNDDLLIVFLWNFDNYYNNHFVMCYGYTRLQSQTTGYYLTYMNIADGLSLSPRYLVLASVLDMQVSVIHT